MTDSTVEKENRVYCIGISVLALLGAVFAVCVTDMPIGAVPSDYIVIALVGAILGPMFLGILALLFGLASI